MVNVMQGTDRTGNLRSRDRRQTLEIRLATIANHTPTAGRKEVMWRMILLGRFLLLKS